jgi:hypothetical protein
MMSSAMGFEAGLNRNKVAQVRLVSGKLHRIAAM